MKNNGIVEGVGKWFFSMFFFGFLFYIALPATKPGTAGSALRFVYFVYTNMGLTYYEFFSFFYLIILLYGAYAWIVKAKT